MSTLLSDLRYAARMLNANRGFTTIAILTLALGIGANTTIFTLVNAVFLNPLPVRDAARLISVYMVDERNAVAGNSLLSMSYDNFKDYRDANTVFDGLAGALPNSLILSDEGGRSPEAIPTILATANMFDVLGVAPVAGRMFRADEDRHDGADNVAVISHSLWQRRFNGSPAVIGRTIFLNGHGYTVVGISPRGFKGITSLARADRVWIPISMHAQSLSGLGLEIFRVRRGTGVNVFGRLKPGVTIAQAQAAMDPIAGRLARDFPRDNAGRGVRLGLLEEGAIGINQRQQFVLAGTVLMTVAAFVLLIASTNLANLLLARASSRECELAVRAAIGASRRRLLRQLLTESLLLSTLGCAAGLLLASFGRDALWAMRPPFLTADAVQLSFDGRVLGFTIAVSVATGLLFGALPALRASKPNVNDTLKSGGRSGGALSGRGGRLRSALVVVEMAIALVALAGAGVFIRSLQAAQRMDLGFESRRLFVVSLNPPPVGYPAARVRQLYEDVQARAAALPGVEGAAIAQFGALGGGQIRSAFPEGQAQTPGQRGVFITQNVVSPAYFETLRIPLVRGRLLDSSDTDQSRAVAVINEAMAEKFWSGQDPIGRRFTYFNDTTPKEIIGIVRNTTISQVGEDPRPVAYQPIAQYPAPFASLHARTAGDPTLLAAALQKAVTDVDPNVAVTGTNTIDELLDQTLYGTRMGATLLSVFAGLALLLAAMGVYGVLSYAVSQRTQEIGVRLALGARRLEIVSLVMKDGLSLAIGGAILGAVAAVALGRFVASLLYQASPTEPLPLVVVTLVLISVAVLACYIPSRRATRVEPVVALRSE